MYKQVKKFDLKKAGNKKGLCLQNVRLGYGIPAKYGNATAAWKGTEQHRDRSIPKDVDVPVFFSYTTTIGKIKDNYGHIGVQLKSGKFWSDGVTYSNLAAYEKNHAPKYLGWGESVNSVRVIQESKEVIVKVNPITWWVYDKPNGKKRGIVRGGQKYKATIDKAGFARIGYLGKPGYISKNAYSKV